MRYLDIFYQVYGSDSNWLPDTKILVWSAHHEHAVFDLKDEVHPASVVVWFQYWLGVYDDPPTVIGRLPKSKNTIHKVELKKGQWKFAERSFGSIPYCNHNPFKPGGDAASNTAESVFDVNK